MGIDTKGIIGKGVTLQDIVKVLSKNYDDVEVYNTSQSYYKTISFSDGKKNRLLSVFINYFAKNNYGIDGTLLSLGLWGDSISIMKTLLNEFGGYLDENDCDDIGFLPINEDEYLKRSTSKSKDAFILEVIHELGYDNLEKAMDLFEKYKKLKK